MKAAPLTFALLLFVSRFVFAEIEVTSDFEGGSGEVTSIDQETQTIVISPTDHPGKGWRCWWYVKIEGVKENSTLTMNIGDAPWATPDRAHLSYDGETWNHSAPGVREGKRILYTIPVAEKTSLYLAWGPPFLPSDASQLVASTAKGSQFATAFELCKTREGRATPALEITAPGDSSAREVIWIQARQHAWESGSSWVGKGMIDFLVSDHPQAAAMRKRAVIFVVPIMDIDNTFRGAGGKSQKPQDHNRDWTSSPHWNAVRAAQKHITEADKAGRLVLFIDLHNPGANDRFPYFYTSPREQLAPVGVQNLAKFVEAAKAEMTGPLRFTGKTIESGAKYDPKAWQAISKNWVSENSADHVVAVTLETSWNTPASTIGNYETVGRQLGMAIERFLSQL